MQTDEILDEFRQESKELLEQMIDQLEGIEGDFSQVDKLADSGGLVDRIMGGAKSIAMEYDKDHFIHKIAAYSEICKIVSYKGSQIKDNEQFYDICVAFLLDATEMLEIMVDSLGRPNVNIKDILSNTFLERLHWVNTQFDDNLRASVGFKESQQIKPVANDQAAIDELLKTLGIG